MFDLVTLIKAVGYIGLFTIVFAESGLLIGFFLPGDSLLFIAGFLASQGFLNIWLLSIGVFLCAVIGDSVGYAFGRKVGPLIFIKENSFFFHRDYLERARTFYEKHGKATIILARFLPVIRTFVPILAGVGKMHYPTFLTYNIIGGLIWGAGISWLGYFLGNTVPNIDRYLIPVILAVIVLSSLPTLFYIFRNQHQ